MTKEERKHFAEMLEQSCERVDLVGEGEVDKIANDFYRAWMEEDKCWTKVWEKWGEGWGEHLTGNDVRDLVADYMTFLKVERIQANEKLVWSALRIVSLEEGLNIAEAQMAKLQRQIKTLKEKAKEKRITSERKGHGSSI